jgi:DNA-binding MarR family transcriptional regulator
VSRAELSAELTEQVREQQIAYDRFHDAVAAYLGINRTDLRCLDLIDLRGKQTPGEISQVTGLTTGAVTAMLDRLERAGYIQRARDSSDRRRVLVELTDLARKRGAEVYQPFATQAGPMFARFSVDQLATLRDFVRIGNDFYAEQIARVEALARDTYDH